MGYHIETQVDNHIVIIHKGPNFQATEHIHEVMAEIETLQATTQGDIVRIFDFTQAAFTFSDTVLWLGEKASTYRRSLEDSHIHTYFVGDNATVKLMVDSLKQHQYGTHDLQAFTTLEDALITANYVLKENTNE